MEGKLLKNNQINIEKKPKALFCLHRTGFIKFALSVILVIFGLFNIFPFIFMLSSSFKPLGDIFKYPIRIIPETFVISNYTEVLFGKFSFYNWYVNTVVMVIVSIILKSIIVSMAGYSFARLRFKGRNTLFLILLSAIMIPGDVTLIPRYVVYKALGITNSMWSMIFLYTFDMFFVFMMKQFFSTIPFELSEAAIIDGCSQFKVFYKVILPNVKPAFVTMILFTFVWQWNDFMNPFIFITNEKKQMLSVGIQFFQERMGSNYGVQMAATTLILIPVIIVFFSSQKYFVEGIATTGVKG